MSALRLLAAVVMIVALSIGAGTANAQDKTDNAKLLIGIWEVSKVDGGAPLAVGAKVEFVKDGKVKATHKKDDKDEVREGTYKFEKGKLIVSMAANNANVMTIKKLTDTELIVSMDEGGKVLEFKRKSSAGKEK